MSRIAAVAAAAAGSALCVVAIAVALPVFGARPPALLMLLVGGTLLLVGSLVASGREAEGAMTARADEGRRLRLMFRQLSKWSAALGVAAASMVCSRFVEHRIDVTNAGVNTLADESVVVARGVAAPVRVIAFVEPGRAAVELRALVDRYAAVTDRVRLELRSAAAAADLEVARAVGLAELLALGGPNVAVVPAVPGGSAPVERVVRYRFDAGQPDAEEQLTNALRRATTTTTPARVYVVAGHGEADLRDEGPAGLSRLRDALAARNVELAPLPLAVVGSRVPDDARAVMVLPATAAWESGEVAALRAFLDKDGALFVLFEPERPQPSVAAWAARAGVDVVADVVVDEGPFVTLLGGADVVTGSTQLGHAVTRPLKGALTHFPRAAVLGLSPVPDVLTTPLVSTGGDARAATIDARGPLPLVVAAEPTPAPAPSGASWALRGWVASRTVVAADATFVTNGALGLGANRDLAQSILQWLVQDDDHIAVRPRQRGGSLVFLTPSAREALAFVLLVVVPGLLAAAGAAVTAARRAR